MVRRTRSPTTLRAAVRRWHPASRLDPAPPENPTGLAWLHGANSPHATTALLSSAMETLRISRYRILRPLGSGGMGEVYAAEDERLRRKVAIKLIASDKVADSEARERFEREAQAASALNHPNI